MACQEFWTWYVVRTMYTIKQAAGRSGVSVPLLRAWERRYRIVEPARTASGYRLYDDASIARLRAMHLLIEDGWSASTAAAHLLEAGDEAVAAITREADASTAPARLSADATADALVGSFVTAAASLDEPALESLLDEMFARGSFEQVVTALVMPALVALGEGWADGRVDVAGEHAAANAVLRRLGAAFLAAGRPAGNGNVLLVGLPPGGRHELGALAFATAARRAGIAARYLGADLPVQDWLDAATQTSAAAAAIGVVVPGDVDPAERLTAALRAARPDMLIAFGGGLATAVRVPDDEHVLRLPAGLGAAVDELGAAIAAMPPPRRG